MNCFLGIAWLSNLLLFVFSSSVMYNLSLFSLTAKVLLLVNVCAFAFAITKKKMSKEIFQKLVYILGMGFFAYLSYLKTPSGSLVDFLTVILGYLAIPMYFISVKEAKISEKMTRWAQLIIFLIAVFFIYAGFVQPHYRVSTNALDMGYSNSNRTGIYLMMTIAVLININVSEKKRVLWWFETILSVVMLWLIVLTQCRTAFIISTAIIVYRYLPSAPKVGYRFMISCFTIMLLFSALYMALYNSGRLDDFMIMNRPFFSGRERIFQAQEQSSFLGNYSVSFAGLSLLYAVLNTVGYIGLILFLISYGTNLIIPLKRLQKSHINNDKGIDVAIITMGLLVLHGCTESIVYCGGQTYASMYGMILYIIRANTQKSEYGEVF